MGSQRVRIVINKGYRAHMMLEMLNMLQREPQQVDLNIRCELISYMYKCICHAQFSFAVLARADSLVGNQPLYSMAQCLYM